MKHICLPIFNRATYSRIQNLIESIEDGNKIDLTVVLSSSLLQSEYGNASETYIKDRYKKVKVVEIEVPEVKSHLDMALTSAVILDKFARFYADNKFDMILIVADRFEMLPAAIAASYQNIPVIHVQGGEISGNIDDKVRHAITKLADAHYVATHLAKKYVLKMGEEPDRVKRLGCPSLDLIRRYRAKRVLHPKGKHIICIFHPDTKLHPGVAREQTECVMKAVVEYCRTFDHYCHWFWPNPDPNRVEIAEFLEETYQQSEGVIRKIVNIPNDKFLKMLARTRMIIGNSSCGLRESSFIGVPSVNIGPRQHIRQRATNVFEVPDFDWHSIVSAMVYQHDQKSYEKSELFGSGRASHLFVRHLDEYDQGIKGSLQYPYWTEFEDEHFRRDQLQQTRKRYAWSKHTEAIRPYAKRGYIQSEFKALRPVDC